MFRLPNAKLDTKTCKNKISYKILQTQKKYINGY